MSERCEDKHKKLDEIKARVRRIAALLDGLKPLAM